MDGVHAEANWGLWFLSFPQQLMNFNLCQNKRTKPTNEDSTKKEEICPICWNTMEDHLPIHTSCNHVFCMACLKKWLENEENLYKTKTCPICRSEIFSAIYYCTTCEHSIQL